MIKLSVNETKWNSLLARTRSLNLYISIWIFDFGPVKLPGLSRNGPLDIIYFSFIIRAHSRGRGRRGIGLSLTHPSHPPHFRLCKANDWSNNLQLVVSWSSILSPPKNKPFTTCRFPLIVTKVLLFTHDESLAKQSFVISTMSHKPVLFSQVDVIVWHFVSVWYKSNYKHS